MTHATVNATVRGAPAVIGRGSSTDGSGGAPPSLSLTFNGVIPAPAVWSRAGPAFWWDSAGNFISVPSGTPRYFWDSAAGAYTGIYVEPGTTNMVRNPRGEGAAGVTPPTLWAAPTIQGMLAGYTLTWSVGTEQGMPVTYVRVQGTTDGAQNGGQHIFYLEAAAQNGIRAANGGNWTQSMYLRVSAGDLAGISRAPVVWTTNVRTSTGAIIYTPPTQNITPPQDGTVIANCRTFQQFVINDPTNTSYALEMNFRVYPKPGVPIDYTLAIGCPQMEGSAGFLTSPILPVAGTHTATARAADNMSVPLTPAQVGDTSELGILMRSIPFSYNNTVSLKMGLLNKANLAAHGGNDTIDIESYPPGGTGTTFFFMRGASTAQTVDYLSTTPAGQRSAIAGSYSIKIPGTISHGARNGIPATVRSAPDYTPVVYDTLMLREPWAYPTVTAGMPMVVEELRYYPRLLNMAQMAAMTTAPYPVEPTLDLYFLTDGALPPGVVFTRAGTATYTDGGGTIRTAAANAPRWDYDPVKHTLNGLLIEEARTNLVLNSGDISNASWLKSTGGGSTAPVVTANQATAPDGTLTAARVVLPTVSVAASYSYVSAAIAVTPLVYSFSIWLRGSAGGESLWISATADAVTYYRQAITLTTAWQRFSLVTPTLTTTNWFFDTGCDRRDASQIGITAQTIFMWGGQVEAGAYATSYIPTTAAAVLRSAENCSIPTGTWFNAAASSLELDYMLAQATNASLSNARAGVAISDGTATNMIRTLAQDVVGNPVARTSVIVAGAATAGSPLGLTAANAVTKLIGAWDGVHATGCLNGATPVTDAMGMPAGLNVLTPGASFLGSASRLNGWVRRVRYWPAKLSDAQLVAVTT